MLLTLNLGLAIGNGDIVGAGEAATSELMRQVREGVNWDVLGVYINDVCKE